MFIQCGIVIIKKPLAFLLYIPDGHVMLRNVAINSFLVAAEFFQEITPAQMRVVAVHEEIEVVHIPWVVYRL